MDDLLQGTLNAGLDVVVVVVGLIFLRGFGLGPGSDVSHTSSSRGVELRLKGLGKPDVRFGLVPHFALGPVADVSDPASSGRDLFMLRMSNVNGWLDVRGSEIRDVGITSSSNRMRVRVFRNAIDAISGQDTVSTPAALLATVLRLARGR